MSWLRDLNLIHFFSFYLWVVTILSTYRRFDQYHSILTLVRAVPNRWPRLFHLVREHSSVFLTWATVLPALLALALTLAQTVAATFLWPEAGRPPHGLTAGRLAQSWPAAVLVCLLGVLMVGVDFYGVFKVSQVDREMMEKYFDQAEYWLRSWTAPVVRVFTLGFIHPRRLVAEEVRKALVLASGLINYTLWWVTLQVGLRLAFGLALWTTYALHRVAAG